MLEGATTTPSGLQYVDVTVGEGDSPGPFATVRVHYTGSLAGGTKFDSSYDRGSPSDLSMERVIDGFCEALSTMKVGGRRTAYIPANLGYGERGIPNLIPANSDLVFEIELLAIVHET